MISKVRVSKDNYIGDHIVVGVDRKDVRYPRVSITTGSHTLFLDPRQWDELREIVGMMRD